MAERTAEDWAEWVEMYALESDTRAEEYGYRDLATFLREQARSLDQYRTYATQLEGEQELREQAQQEACELAGVVEEYRRLAREALRSRGVGARTFVTQALRKIAGEE